MTVARYFKSGYERAILGGLVLAVWFGASARAAHDLWAASSLFGWTTILGIVFCAGRMLDGKPVKLPLLPACGAFLAAVLLSQVGAYDRNTAVLETWIWACSFLLALLYLNAAETPGDARLFFAAAGAALLVPAAQLLAKLAPGRQVPEMAAASSPWRQIAVVGFFLGGFYGAVLYLVRVFEGRKDRRAGLAFAGFAAAAPIALLGTKWTMKSGETPLINHNVLIGFALNWFFASWKRLFDRGAFLPLFLPCWWILTVERSWWAYVAILAGFAVYYAPDLRRLAARHGPRLLGAAGAAALAVAAIAALKAGQRKYRLEGVSRAYWWEAALRMIRRHPWTGVGAGGYGAAYPFFRSGAVDNTLHAHCFPLQLLAETGILGAAAALCAGVGLLRLAAGPAEDRGERRVYAAAAACVLCFAAVHINLEFFLNKFVLLLLLASLLIGREVPSYRPGAPALAAAGLGLLLAAPFWLSLYQSSRLYVRAQELESRGDVSSAEALCLDAIDLDRTNAGCYWMLSWLSLKRYQDTGSPDAQARSLEYLRKGLRYKREYRFERLAEEVHAAPDGPRP